MRKSLIIFLLIGGMALGLGIFNNLVKSGEIKQSLRGDPLKPASLETPDTNASVTQTLGITQTNPILEPVSFAIPKIGVKAGVEYVGLNSKGAMDIPKNDENVAWYNLGVKPGEAGNAVMAGHYDKKTGAPAVFYEINKLAEGDDINVEDKSGKIYNFTVTKIASYPLEKFPLQEVFGESSNHRLNLITCEGVYDKSSKLYSHRLVVYSELKD